MAKGVAGWKVWALVLGKVLWREEWTHPECLFVLGRLRHQAAVVHGHVDGSNGKRSQRDGWAIDPVKTDVRDDGLR